MNVLNIIGREQTLFEKDIQFLGNEIDQQVRKSSFLIIGGAGSIGKSVAIEIFDAFKLYMLWILVRTIS